MAEDTRVADMPASAGFAELPLAWNLVRALVVAPVVLGLLLIAYESSAIAELPAYPATVVAFLVVVVAPGAVLQGVFLRGSNLGPLERLAIAVPLGLGVAAIPGFIVLERHTDLQEFAALHALVATAVCGLSMLFWRSDREQEPAPEGGGPGRFLLMGVLLVVAGGIVTTPLWAEGRISADFDDWTYLAYANDYVESAELNAREPFLGTDDPVNPRMRSNVWVLLQAQVASVADVPVSEAVLEYLRPLLIVITALATLALTRALFRNTSIALLAAGFHLGYAFIDMSAHEGMGRNLMVRITEDKMIGAFLIFPVALIFLLRFLENRSIPAYAGFCAVVMGLTFVHPVPLMFLATTLVALAFLRVVSERSVNQIKYIGMLLVPVGLASIWPFVQRQLLIDAAPELFGTEASAITFRDEFHFMELGAGLLMGSHHMILHPLMIAAILLVPVLWLVRRGSIAGQLVLAMTAGALVVSFTPFLATPVAEVMTPQTLWKMPWMIPVAPILAAATFEALRRTPRALQVRPVRLVAPVASLVLILAAGLVIVDQYEPLDGGAFFHWRSEESVLPWTERSVFLGGLDRTFTTTWRVPELEREMLTSIEEGAFQDSVVLAEPVWIQHVIPGLLHNIYPVDFGGTAGEGDRREGSMAFAAGEMTVAEFEAFVDRYRIDFVIARDVEAPAEVLRASDRAHFRAEFSPYVVYEMR